jgi:Na+/proline symporter
MVALFTKNRGNDQGNIIAMIAGFIAVALLSNLPNELFHMIAGRNLYENAHWFPIIEFPWRIMFGTIVTALIAICFRSNKSA